MKAKQWANSVQNPNAWIVNPKDKGRKPIKSKNKIYLKDGKNFEIELFNPLKESVLAEIKVNGKSVSSTGLVLRPGERFYLDCFIDDKKKFVFKTYEVEDTNESKEAISLNGTVEVFFYKEETLSLGNWKQIFTPIVERHYYPVYYPWYQPCWYSTTTTIYNGYNNVTLGGSYCGTTLPTSGSSSALYSSNTNICNTSNLSNTNNVYFNSELGTIETGRVEKGEISNQSFTEVDMQFDRYYISHVVYQILPESIKPVETKELTKKFCEECGNKLKGTEKFCPNCGCKTDNDQQQHQQPTHPEKPAEKPREIPDVPIRSREQLNEGVESSSKE